MIGKLRGKIDSISDDEIILDVMGVGYVLFCSANTLRNTPIKGSDSVFFVETHVREDHIHLYGFLTESERKTFRELTKVSGVGAKTALSVLSVLTPDALKNAILAEDKSAFKPVSGVGPKVAARIITELKEKSFDEISAISADVLNISPNKQNKLLGDAVSALTNLGYNRTDAFLAVQRVIANSPEVSLNEAIKFGLKELAA